MGENLNVNSSNKARSRQGYSLPLEQRPIIKIMPWKKRCDRLCILNMTNSLFAKTTHKCLKQSEKQILSYSNAYRNGTLKTTSSCTTSMHTILSPYLISVTILNFSLLSLLLTDRTQILSIHLLAPRQVVREPDVSREKPRKNIEIRGTIKLPASKETRYKFIS